MEKRINLKEVVLTQEEYEKTEDQLKKLETEIYGLKSDLSRLEKAKCVFKEAKVDYYYEYSDYGSQRREQVSYSYKSYSEDEIIKKLAEDAEKFRLLNDKYLKTDTELNNLKKTIKSENNSIAKWQIFCAVCFGIGIIVSKLFM